MQDEKPLSTPLASHFKLSKEMCPKTQEEINYMSKVPYSSIVRSLMYAMACTRPDIAHIVGVVSRYTNNLGKEHWMVVKWDLKYLRGTTTHKLFFWGSDNILQGYVDSNIEGEKDSRRNTTGYVFTVVLMGEKIPCNKGGHCSFCKSQLDSQTFGVAGPIGLWPHYHSRGFVWWDLYLKNKKRF